ncbi:uncharacterized protein L969DRAFT_92566 [Mixia osmundae IAM 14324]|uniref:PIN domain-containing protein n=1 Tax=Mixia osmundae (strain CBS 9802 / IAM 14324 / JCM 22182 / KY 12970) TaxID=764103 RepID=G7DXX0_MIXOS|nr:uncharacterized protein L969DRAFT_92566 [Mixia osmundae IAM 14324]KEI41333.1 hypothetical protein L969DRAFT_92566 [Mixia osmundae IAM 14324]GAA95430.1 hypothetical protein E5Q_02084 [Mixia osmundae IAM 14324]
MDAQLSDEADLSSLSASLNGTSLSQHVEAQPQGTSLLSSPAAHSMRVTRSMSGTARPTASAMNTGPNGQVPPPSSPSKGCIYIVDTSALLYALPVVRRWAREEAHTLIIPVEVINTLDALKKLPPPMSHKVRATSKYIEEQFARKSTGQRTKLHAQMPHQTLPWQAIHLGQTPSVQVATHNLDDTPAYLKPLLQCARHFERSSQGGKDVRILYALGPLDEPVETPRRPVPARASTAPQSPTRATMNGSNAALEKNLHHLNGNSVQWNDSISLRAAADARNRALAARGAGHTMAAIAPLFDIKTREITVDELSEAKAAFAEWQQGQATGNVSAPSSPFLDATAHASTTPVKKQQRARRPLPDANRSLYVP